MMSTGKDQGDRRSRVFVDTDFHSFSWRWLMRSLRSIRGPVPSSIASSAGTQCRQSAPDDHLRVPIVQDYQATGGAIGEAFHGQHPIPGSSEEYSLCISLVLGNGQSGAE